MKNSYIGIIPSNIRYDKELIFRDKILYCEITATINEDYCKKTNAYFAKVLDVSRQSISKSLTALRQKNHIHVVIEKKANSNAVLNRYIFLNKNSDTYASIIGGVEDASQNTHASIVAQGNPVNADIVDNSNANTNTGSEADINNIKYIKSIKDVVAEIQLLPELNQKQITYLGNIVYDFYNEKSKQFPEVVKKDWQKNDNLVNDAINTLYMIIKLDDYSEKIVRDVIKWATNDDFWHSNLISLRNLRKKSNNGETKFTNIYLKYKGRK